MLMLVFLFSLPKSTPVSTIKSSDLSYLRIEQRCLIVKSYNSMAATQCQYIWWKLSKFHRIGFLQTLHDSRVVTYDRRIFTRLATGQGLFILNLSAVYFQKYHLWFLVRQLSLWSHHGLVPQAGAPWPRQTDPTLPRSTWGQKGSNFCMF